MEICGNLRKSVPKNTEVENLKYQRTGEARESGSLPGGVGESPPILVVVFENEIMPFNNYHQLTKEQYFRNMQYFVSQCSICNPPEEQQTIIATVPSAECKVGTEVHGKRQQL